MFGRETARCQRADGVWGHKSFRIERILEHERQRRSFSLGICLEIKFPIWGWSHLRSNPGLFLWKWRKFSHDTNGHLHNWSKVLHFLTFHTYIHCSIEYVWYILYPSQVTTWAIRFIDSIVIANVILNVWWQRDAKMQSCRREKGILNCGLTSFLVFQPYCMYRTWRSSRIGGTDICTVHIVGNCLHRYR